MAEPTSEPTPEDHANAARRQEIAARFRAEYEAARSLAEQALGPGWVPHGRHRLIAHAEADRCRRTGEQPSAAASVYTAANGGAKRHFTVIDGTPTEVPSVDAGFGAMLTEPDPERAFTDRSGNTHRLHRYGVYWSGFEADYRPKTATQLAAARARREQRAVAEEAAGNFAEQVLAEGYAPNGRGR